MCDCYSTKCEFCENQIETHIGDFSTSRENVKAVCHECVIEGEKFDDMLGGKPWAQLPRMIEREDQVWRHLPAGDTIDVGVVGQVVLLYCCDVNGHDIHLN